jgi:hypothetical protein
VRKKTTLSDARKIEKISAALKLNPDRDMYADGRARLAALELPNVDWKALEEAVQGLPDEIVVTIRDAKRATYVTAVTFDTPERALLERDEDIRAYMETEEFQIHLRNRQAPELEMPAGGSPGPEVEPSE